MEWYESVNKGRICTKSLQSEISDLKIRPLPTEMIWQYTPYFKSE